MLSLRSKTSRWRNAAALTIAPTKDTEIPLSLVDLSGHQKCHRAVTGSTSAQRLLVVGALLPALRNEVSIKNLQALCEAPATFVAWLPLQGWRIEVSIKSGPPFAEGVRRIWTNEVSITSTMWQSDSSSGRHTASFVLSDTHP